MMARSGPLTHYGMPPIPVSFSPVRRRLQMLSTSPMLMASSIMRASMTLQSLSHTRFPSRILSMQVLILTPSPLRRLTPKLRPSRRPLPNWVLLSRTDTPSSSRSTNPSTAIRNTANTRRNMRLSILLSQLQPSLTLLKSMAKRRTSLPLLP